MEWKNKSEALATLEKNVLSTLLIKVLPLLSNIDMVLLVHSVCKSEY